MITNVGFYILGNLFLASRLAITAKDEKISRNNFFIMLSIQLASFIFLEFNKYIYLAIGVVLLSNILYYKLEKKTKKINKLRLLFLIVLLVILGVIFAPGLGTKPNPQVLGLLNSVSFYLIPQNSISGLEWKKILIIVFGLLLATSETNLVIRYIFDKLDLAPKLPKKSNESKIDQKEYNAGRIIGILERTLIFILVLLSEFGAIGFIIAAKSVTRFKELEKREFAEYVLIGTLLSTTLAILIAGITSYLLKPIPFSGP
ncbi:MAG: hypothetical protein OEZ02_01350 [Anaerolineae bacterium]|nr:hypothetical protein [Anaerolineae bacterium]